MAALLILPDPSTALKICVRLQKRFYCVGVKLCPLTAAQARSLAVTEPSSQPVLATAWALDDPGLWSAFELFANSEPGGLKATFGHRAVIGPVDASLCFAASELLLELAEPEAAPVAAAAQQRHTFPMVSASPTARPPPDLAKPKESKTERRRNARESRAQSRPDVVELSISRTAAGSCQLVELRIARAQCEVPCAHRRHGASPSANQTSAPEEKAPATPPAAAPQAADAVALSSSKPSKRGAAGQMRTSQSESLAPRLEAPADVGAAARPE